MDSRVRPNAWIETTLLVGIALAFAGACAVLALMIVQAPAAMRTANQPATAPAILSPAAILPLHTPPPTETATPPAKDVPSPTPSATHTAPASPTATTVPLTGSRLAASRGAKWIDIDISEQTLTAYEGETPVLNAPVSTGKPNTPTPLGEFEIYAHVPTQDMGGPGYLLPDVQYVAYFEGDYAIHATYWHDNFGQPMSHGCVNMRTADAQWLYRWAPNGTPVRVHD